MPLSPLQVPDYSNIFILFFAFVVVIIIIGATRAGSWKGRVQRPLSETTAYAPPPPPDTVTVKCEYCGTEQTWRENCIQCGAPLSKPKTP